VNVKAAAAIVLFAALTTTAGWQFFRYRAQERAISQVTVPATPTATAAAGANGDDERVPFSLQGRSYTAILKKKRPENAVVSFQLLNSRGTVLYERALPYQIETADDPYSEFAIAGVQPLSRGGGSGLLLSYSIASQPSATVEENTNWYQLFGVINGDLKAFGEPMSVEGELLDSKSEFLDFKLWAHHFRIVFPVRVDWAAGKLLPAHDCENQSGECEYDVRSEELHREEGVTFVRLCPAAGTACEMPERVLVKTDSKIDLLKGRAYVKWTGQEISVPEAEHQVWLLVRVDGKEGWIHDNEDFDSLGLPSDQ